MDAIVFGLIVLASLNLYLSMKVCFDAGLTPAQKIMQLAIVWLFPFIGGIGVFLVHREDELPKPRRTKFDCDDGHDGVPGGTQ
jgi:hypothetical protein